MAEEITNLGSGTGKNPMEYDLINGEVLYANQINDIVKAIKKATYWNYTESNSGGNSQ